MDSVQLQAFYDELEKIAGIFHRERSGRKPISMAKLIDRHNELGHLPRKGKEYRTKKADAAGSPQPVRGDSCDDPGAAQAPKHRGDVPTRDPGNIPQSAKLGYRLTDTTLPTTWGEDMTADTTVPKKPGDVPTQGSLDVSSPNARSGRLLHHFTSITNDQSAKRPKKGDTPTRDDDINRVGREDLRDSTTTVQGLGQHSMNIGAVNSPAEHT